MNSQHTISRSFFLVLSIAITLLTAQAKATNHGGSLQLDGRFRTGGKLNDARITLHQAGRAPQRIEAQHAIDMQVEYQQEYLLVFEKPGHVTKTLLFDTKVPAQLATTPMTFKFQVTLDPAPKGYDTAYYSAPVGIIRFLESELDFGYDTNYDLQRIKAAYPIILADTTTTITSMEPTPTTGLPSVSAIAEAVIEIVEPAQVLVIATEAPTLADPTPDTLPVEVPQFASTESLPTPELVTAVPAIAQKPSPIDPDRSEEVIVERTHVIRVVRIVQGGLTTECRKVVHAWGATFYFLNGVSCSDRTYAMWAGR